MPGSGGAQVQPTCEYPERSVLRNGDTVGELHLWWGIQLFCEHPESVRITRNGTEVPMADTWGIDRSTGLILLRFLRKPIPDGQYQVTLSYQSTAPDVQFSFVQSDVVARFNAYGQFRGGADVAAGDVDGDGRDEVITGAGPSGGPHVIIWKIGETGVIGARPFVSFMAYAEGFRGGVHVAAGDVDGDGRDEVLTGPGPGGGPHVRIWKIPHGTTVVELGGFMAYTPGFAGGVDVDAADLIDGSEAEIITGAGPGGGPHVRVMRWSPGGFSELTSFFPYDPRFPGGVNVSGLSGNTSTPKMGAVVTGAGGGGGPHVRFFYVFVDPQTGRPANTNYDDPGFFAYDPGFRGGVDVATPRFFGARYPSGGDTDQVLTGAGPGGGPHVRTFSESCRGRCEMAGYFAWPTEQSGGVRVAGGNFTGDPLEDLVTVPATGEALVEVRPF